MFIKLQFLCGHQNEKQFLILWYIVILLWKIISWCRTVNNRNFYTQFARWSPIMNLQNQAVLSLQLNQMDGET